MYKLTFESNTLIYVIYKCINPCSYEFTQFDKSPNHSERNIFTSYKIRIKLRKKILRHVKAFAGPVLIFCIELFLFQSLVGTLAVWTVIIHMMHIDFYTCIHVGICFLNCIDIVRKSLYTKLIIKFWTKRKWRKSLFEQFKFL